MKAYQLLRNNKQSGPFTADELTAMSLRMFDLIWVEGESIMWKYPSEIREFQHFAPHAEMTEGTKVNSRKEKQMAYFQLCISEMGFKKLNIDSIIQPDAILSDIPSGYEYLVLAQSHKLPENEVVYRSGVEKEAADDAVMQVNEMLNRSYTYTVLGAQQMIDTPEVAANIAAYGTTIEMTIRSKRKTNETAEEVTAPAAEKRRGIPPGIAGWVAVVTAAFMHLKA